MRITILSPALGKLTGHTAHVYQAISSSTHAVAVVFFHLHIENISICHFVLASPTEYEVSCSVSSQIASDHRIVQCENRNRELQRFYPCDSLVQSMQQLSTAIGKKNAKCMPSLRLRPHKFDIGFVLKPRQKDIT